MEIKLESTYKGTRILAGESAKKKRDLLNRMSELLIYFGYSEIMIPIIQLSKTFESKVGVENNNMMFTFVDRGDRNVCLAPEYTAVIQQLAHERFKYEKDMKLFYIAECFRGENPQAGRYRQFTQLGVEIINPTKDYKEELIELSETLVNIVVDNIEIDCNATRGLDYYKEGKGFEIRCPELGSSKQVCGGGSYSGGIGFAIGIDRLLLLLK